MGSSNARKGRVLSQARVDTGVAQQGSRGSSAQAIRHVAARIVPPIGDDSQCESPWSAPDSAAQTAHSSPLYSAISRLSHGVRMCTMPVRGLALDAFEAPPNK